MTTNTKANCSATDLCHYDSATRARFFHGMLLTDEDLRGEQAYHRNALKRVNRYLWGSGIVCGLAVDHVSGLCIQVHPGAALDCDGNLIEVCKCTSIDLSKLCKDLYPGGCIPANKDPVTKYLVIKYAEVDAEPVPVQSGDDCASNGEATKCQPSRYREGYCLELRDECPNAKPCGEDPKGRTGLLASLIDASRSATREGAQDVVKKNHPGCFAGPPCPDCGCGCGECAVGVAELVIDCSKSEVTVNCKCREYVCSPRLTRWLTCELLGGLEKATSTTPAAKLGAMIDARALVGHPVNALWDIGAAYAFSAADAKHRLKGEIDAGVGERIQQFARGLRTQELRELYDLNTRLKERVDEMQDRKLVELTALVEELKAQVASLAGGKAKK